MLTSRELIASLEDKLRNLKEVEAKSEDMIRIEVEKWYSQIIPGPRGGATQFGKLKEYFSSGTGDVIPIVDYVEEQLRKHGFDDKADRLKDYYKLFDDPKSC